MAKRKKKGSTPRAKTVTQQGIAKGLGTPWSPTGSIGKVTKAATVGGPVAPQPK
jgi:hypothetical protein